MHNDHVTRGSNRHVKIENSYLFTYTTAVSWPSLRVAERAGLGALTLRTHIHISCQMGSTEALKLLLDGP